MSWNFQVNLSGIAPASAGTRELPEGFYSGTVIGAEPGQSSTGRTQIALKVQVADGEFMGIVRTTRLGVPQTPEDKVLYYWRACFESLGYTPAQIDAGAVTVSEDILKGRTAHFYYKPGDKDAGIYEDFKFLTPSDWTSRKTSFEAGKAAQGSALGSAQVAKAAAGGVVAAPMGSALGGLNGGGLGGGLGGGMGQPSVSVAAPASSIGGNAVSKDSLLAALNRG
jgi:hypothetical protein